MDIVYRKEKEFVVVDYLYENHIKQNDNPILQPLFYRLLQLKDNSTEIKRETRKAKIMLK